MLVLLAGVLAEYWLPGVLFGLAAGGLALMYYLGHSVILYENGLDVRSNWMSRRVTWNQIERVQLHERPFRLLTLTTSLGVPVVYFPLDFENLASIRDDIARCAGPDHPLVKGLTRTTQQCNATE